jgi:hypothetical protein
VGVVVRRDLLSVARNSAATMRSPHMNVRVADEVSAVHSRGLKQQELSKFERFRGQPGKSLRRQNGDSTKALRSGGKRMVIDNQVERASRIVKETRF